MLSPSASCVVSQGIVVQTARPQFPRQTEQVDRIPYVSLLAARLTLLRYSEGGGQPRATICCQPGQEKVLTS